MAENFKKAVKFYQERHLPILALYRKHTDIKRLKTPMWLGWSEKTLAELQELMTSQHGLFNIGLRLDDLVCIDIDAVELAQKYFSDDAVVKMLPETLVCYRDGRTPTKVAQFQERGHLYFKRPPWLTKPVKYEKVIGIEIRVGVGMQCVVPPSIHPDGTTYRWSDYNWLDKLPELPKTFWDYTLELLNKLGIQESQDNPIVHPSDETMEHRGEQREMFRKKSKKYSSLLPTPEFQKILEDLNSRPIKDVVAHLQLKPIRSNHYWCPRCVAQNSPHLSISETKNIFKCFGCGESGGGIGLMMLHDPRVDGAFTRAVDELAALYKIEVPHRRYQETQYTKKDLACAVDLDLEAYKVSNLIEVFKTPQDTSILDVLRKFWQEKQPGFCIEAMQGAGKSYSASMIAIDRLIAGYSTIILSRTHDELKQYFKSIALLMAERKLPLEALFHLAATVEEENGQYFPSKIPDRRPLILLAPHVYLMAKGDTPYCHELVYQIRDRAFGNDLMVLIDEATSFIDGLHVSKPLGCRLMTKDIHGYKLRVPIRTCQLHSHSGNCTNCQFDRRLKPVRNRANQIEYEPIGAHQEADTIAGEEPRVLTPVGTYVDNTMTIQQLIPFPKLEDWETAWQRRVFSTGTGDDVRLEVSLTRHLEDLMLRLEFPHLVRHYPYDTDNTAPLGRPLTSMEIEARQAGELTGIIPPAQPCEVPALQGWDSLPIRSIKDFCQLGLLGPGFSETHRFVALSMFDGSLVFHAKDQSVIKLNKVLLLVYDGKLGSKNQEYRQFIQHFTKEKKTILFTPTKNEAYRVAADFAEICKTIFYDGEEHTRFATPSDELGWNTYVSYSYGPLGQGINLWNFRHCIADCNVNKPKFALADGYSVDTIRQKIFQNSVDTVLQNAGRLMRINPDDPTDADIPRVVILHGDAAAEIASYVYARWLDVGHMVKMLRVEKSLSYAMEVVKHFEADLNLSALEAVSPALFNSTKELEEKQAIVTNLLEATPDLAWNEIKKQLHCHDRNALATLKEFVEKYKFKIFIDKKIAAIVELGKKGQIERRIINQRFNLYRGIEDTVREEIWKAIEAALGRTIT